MLCCVQNCVHLNCYSETNKLNKLILISTARIKKDLGKVAGIVNKYYENKKTPLRVLLVGSPKGNRTTLGQSIKPYKIDN